MSDSVIIRIKVLLPAKAVTSCVVCNAMKGVSSLGVCSNCQEFLTDSVSEASHTSMTCLHSGTCHVSSSNTATTSATETFPHVGTDLVCKSRLSASK